MNMGGVLKISWTTKILHQSVVGPQRPKSEHAGPTVWKRQYQSILLLFWHAIAGFNLNVGRWHWLTYLWGGSLVVATSTHAIVFDITYSGCWFHFVYSSSCGHVCSAQAAQFDTDILMMMWLWLWFSCILHCFANELGKRDLPLFHHLFTWPVFNSAHPCSYIADHLGGAALTLTKRSTIIMSRDLICIVVHFCVERAVTRCY